MEHNTIDVSTAFDVLMEKIEAFHYPPSPILGVRLQSFLALGCGSPEQVCATK